MSTYFEEAFTQEEFEDAVHAFLDKAVESAPEGIQRLKARALAEGIAMAVPSVRVTEMRSLGPIQDLLKAGWGKGPRPSEGKNAFSVGDRVSYELCGGLRQHGTVAEILSNGLVWVRDSSAFSGEHAVDPSSLAREA